MIALHSTTDPRWVEVALANFEAVLIDHAHCEKKAAASAMALVNRYPEKTELVRRCVKLAQEDLGSALIEGRSWERLCLLGEHLPEEGDRSFYRGLAQSEAGHYRLFLDLAKRYEDPDAVEARFKELAEYEAAIVASLPIEPRIH